MTETSTTADPNPRLAELWQRIIDGIAARHGAMYEDPADARFDRGDLRGIPSVLHEMYASVNGTDGRDIFSHRIPRLSDYEWVAGNMTPVLHYHSGDEALLWGDFPQGGWCFLADGITDLIVETDGPRQGRVTSLDVAGDSGYRFAARSIEELFGFWVQLIEAGFGQIDDVTGRDIFIIEDDEVTAATEFLENIGAGPIVGGFVLVGDQEI